MYAKVLPVFFSLALILVSGATPAQTKGKGSSAAQSVPDTRPPNFPSLFQNPTRNNGYEEWVLAADLVQNNTEIDAATQSDATLTLKRHILADPAAAQALSLLRDGLQKPVVSPRDDFNETVVLPELTTFRKLGRLLCTAQYVHFADGRVEAAIDDLRTGLAFGYRIQTDNLISGVVGLAVESNVLVEFSRHFDQLSVAQCAEALRIVQDFLNAESPAIHLLSLEKGYAFKMLETRRADPRALRTLLGIIDLQKHPEESANVQSVQNLLTAHPQDLNTILNAAQARIDAVYDQALLNLSLPAAQRTPFVKDKADTPDAALCRLFAVNPDRVLDRYTENQAKLRLLGLHLLIHRYRWEHNMFPNALTDLHAEDLAQDPFTGDPIRYRREGTHYLLVSQGPFKRDDVGEKMSEARNPVQLIP
ncbi:MAG: hypothetical protein JWL77_6100 [Chthonomonadaceae bacterium]|nr:hypothetical protein [Chthonomonadaceae bacterium]